MAEEHTWETVSTASRQTTLTQRLRVPGGWIYQSVVSAFSDGSGERNGVAMVFVPDPKNILPKT